MLRAVSPLLIWFWSAFPWLFCNFVFKSSVAASLMCDTMHDEWLQCQSAWECVDACMSVAICAAGVESWCACAFELWCEIARISCLRLCAFGDVLSHLNTYDVALLVKYRSCLWRYGCDVGHADWRETWKIFGCENVLKFYSYSISVHILQLLTVPPSSSQALTTKPWESGTWPRSSRSRSWKVTRTGWGQLRSTRAGSTWRQVRGEEHDQRRDMIAPWTWWPSWQE